MPFGARERVILSDGFVVETDAHFQAEIDPSSEPDAALDYGYQDHQYFLETASGPWGSLGWTYDKIGNRLTEERNGETDTYTYSSNNGGNSPLLESIALSGGGSRNYFFGDAGHLEEVTAGANILDFSSDDAGRLASIDRLGETVSFTYDGRSFLTGVDNPAGGGPDASLAPVYSSEGLIQSLIRQPLPPEPEESFHFFYFAGRPVAQLVQIDGGTSIWTFLATDHLGTPLLATDLSGTEIWSGPFEPFGEDPFRGTSESALANDVLLRFPGQWDDPIWHDATEGAPLHYNVHRWYEFGTGRYSRRDPVGLQGGVNELLYVDSNPISFFDPLGLTCRTNWDFFWDWLFERGDAKRYYGPGAQESNELKDARPGSFMRNLFKSRGCQDIQRESYGTITAARQTLYQPCSTGAQLGGFLWSAHKSPDCKVVYRVYNVASLHSFAYQIPGVPYKERGGSFPFGGNLRQYFYWTEDNPCGCDCEP